METMDINDLEWLISDGPSLSKYLKKKSEVQQVSQYKCEIKKKKEKKEDQRRTKSKQRRDRKMPWFVCKFS